MPVSVVVATRNEERNIARILDDLRAQTHPDIEVIVVDNGSTDRTRVLAREGGATVYDLADHVPLEGVRNFRGAQVNFGVERSRGQIIFYPDADMTFAPGLIAEAVQLLTDHDALFVPEIIMGQGYFGQIRRFERWFYTATCIDSPRFITRSMFDAVGGFDTRGMPFGPDDWDMAKMLKRAGARLATTRSNKFHHEEWLTVSTYIAKKAAYSGTFADYVRKWGEGDSDVRRQLGVAYRYLGVFLEDGKWRYLLSRPHLAVGMYALRVAVGVAFLMRRKRGAA
ncbi:Glycosyltransferase [Paramagnetospirillum magnetotacticum MS-1]|uniref:Glycosyltransferase n=1 Tax=Paramagnetospirillum magnetotacticum MS-1 TaxID=272627 RepID=A0A0C2V3B2_PARME|nr:Glycosyltransferase [Paramagnetospirillum magnetotacticum MS-1]